MNIDYIQPMADLLTGSTDVMSIVGSANNIYFADSPASATTYITVYEVDEISNGYSKTHIKRVQINCFHTDKIKCLRLQEYVDEALHTFQGSQSGLVFTSIYRINSTGLTKTDNGGYIAINDYRVIY